MAKARRTLDVFVELAELFASSPTPDQVLAFRPSKGLQQRATALLLKRNEGKRLTDEEQHDMDAFTHAEAFMRLLKAKLRVQESSRSSRKRGSV